MKLPVFTLDTVYHYGDVNIEKKNNHSNEGQCLSASLCPDAWMSITRRTGSCHELSKEKANFLNIPDFLNNSSLEKRALKYGKDNGLIERATIYEHEFHCGDTDETMIERSLFPDEDWPKEDVTEKMDWIGTNKLFEKTGHTAQNTDAINPRELLVICYAEELSIRGDYQLDGIFFDHYYDPNALSAPSFGIFPHKLKEFIIKDAPIPDDIIDVRLAGKDGILDPKKPENSQRRRNRP